MLPGRYPSAHVLLLMFSIVLGLGIVVGLAFHAETLRSLAEQPVDDLLAAPDRDTSVRTARALFDASYPIESDPSSSDAGSGVVPYTITVNDTLVISVEVPQPKDVVAIQSVAALDTELRALQLEDYYQANESDCSELSAFVEWWLEYHNVHAYIVEGRIAAHPALAVGNLVYEADNGGPHAWIEAEVDGESILIECTGVYLVPDALEPYYIEEGRFEDVQTLVTWYHEAGYDVQSVLREYDWWAMIPDRQPGRRCNSG